MKQVRIILTIMLLFVSVCLVKGQGRYGADSAECVKYLSYYKEYVNQGNFTEAAPLWHKAFKLCPPQSSQNMLIDGMKIMRMDINRFKNNPVRRAALIDTLMLLHDTRIATFPKYRVRAVQNKALDMMNYLTEGKEKEIFKVCEEVMDCSHGNTPIAIIVRYMGYANDMYMAGTMGADEVMQAFQMASTTIDMVEKVSPGEEAAKAKKDIENLFMQSGVANCENLVELFTPRYKENPENKDVLSNIVAMLSASECIDTELFRQAVQSLYSMDKTHNMAYMLYKLYAGNNENEKAVEYLQEAIDLEDSDKAQEGEYYLEMGTFIFKKMNNAARAISAAKNAAEASSTVAGKAYLLIGTIWSAQKCEGNDIEVRARFWVAVDYLNKAKNADSSLAEEVNPMIKTYTEYFPAQAEAFMFDIIDGENYTVSCGGLRETTKVRTQK